MENILNLSLRIRELFIQAKSKQLGRTYRPSPRQDKQEFWTKAAAKCELLGAKPEDFIKCVFEYKVGKDSGGPYVTQLYSKAVDVAYDKYCGDFCIQELEEDSFLEELFLQQNSVRIWRKYIDEAKAELLNDPSLEPALERLKFNINKIYEFNKYD